MRGDRAICAMTPWDAKEKQKDGRMGPQIRERRGREGEGGWDRAQERDKETDIGEVREGEIEKIGWQWVWKKDNRLVEMESDQMLKQQERERIQSAASRWSPRIDFKTGPSVGQRLIYHPIYSLSNHIGVTTHSLTLVQLSQEHNADQAKQPHTETHTFL